MSGRTLVLGDIHGARRALDQVLERCGFDNDNDSIIFLGDFCDGWPESKQVAERLMEIKRLIPIEGNHDQWFFQWIRTGIPDRGLWLPQGGQETFDSYEGVSDRPAEEREFYRQFRRFYVDGHNRLYVHGGVPKRLRDVPHDNWRFVGDGIVWDRSLFQEAARQFIGESPPNKIVKQFKEIYIGHTTTESFSLEPCTGGGVWMMDQGAGWGGCLSIMDVDTKEYWTSDIVADLYPEVKGRV